MEDNRSRPTAEFVRPAPLAGLEVHDLIRALYRHRRVMAGLFVTVVAGAVLYVVTASPVYEARTQLMIEPDNPKLAAFDDGGRGERDLTPYYQTQYAILKSRTLAHRTIDELGLWDAPEFAAVPPPASDQGRASTIDRFLARLTISYKVNSRLVDIVFEAHDPTLAANVANTLARLYTTQNVELRVTPFTETAGLLDVKLAEQRRRVETSDLALQQYLEKHEVASTDGHPSIVTQRLTAVTAALTEATAERVRRQVRYEQLEALKDPTGTLDAAPLMVASPVVQTLKSELATLQLQFTELAQRYGALHPEVVRARAGLEMTTARLAAEIATVVDAARADYRAGVEREKRVEAQLQALRAAELAEDRNGIAYRALERDAATNRAILETLLKRAEETKISGALTPSSVQVVDTAEVPQVPVRPQQRVIVVLATGLGAMASFGLAFFLEFGRDRIRSMDEIRTGLGLRPLGLLPLEAAAPSGATPASPHFVEAIRTVRSNVLTLLAKDVRSWVLVTSAGTGEGKTTVACSLAVALAELTQRAGNGKSVPPRVLLVDADMRAPRVHDLLGVPLGPGLAELIEGAVPLTAALRPSTIPGLCVLPAGVAKTNAADALGSPAFKKVLQSLNQVFEIVVIDSPPILAVADAGLIAREGPPVLLVIGADKADLRSVRAALDEISGPDTRILGAVLNRATVQQHPYYYFPYTGLTTKGRTGTAGRPA